METINIVYITDSSYVLPTKVSIRSLIAHTSQDRIYNVNVIGVELKTDDAESLCSLSTDNVTVSAIEKPQFGINVADHPYVSKAALFKFSLGSIFSELDKIIYIDGDTLVLDDIKTLYDIDIQDYYAAAVEDMAAVYISGNEFNKKIGHEHYFNSGVMLLNLKLWREDYIEQKLIYEKEIETDHHFMDQNPLNIVLGGNTIYLPPKYNFLNIFLDWFGPEEVASFYRTSLEEIQRWNESPVVLHLAGGIKPWKEHDAHGYNEWMKYVDSSDAMACVRNYFEREKEHEKEHEKEREKERESLNKVLKQYQARTNENAQLLYHAADSPNVFKRLIKKTIAKLMSWYVMPYLEEQNRLMCSMIDDITRLHSDSKDEIEKERHNSTSLFNNILDGESEYSLNHRERNKEVIVSLTSVPERFNTLHFVIRNMLLQTMKPDRIILYLDDFINYEQLPESLTSLIKYGLEIEFRPLNLKPHKKYYFAMKEHPEACIITVDDDWVYSNELIEELYNTSLRFPNCVVAARAHKITFSEELINPYSSWGWECEDSYKPSMLLFATSGGGTLYPPESMHSDLFNCGLISRLAPLADDVWLKTMQVLKETKVVLCNQRIRREMVEIPGTQAVNLSSANVLQKRNDVYISNVMEYYNIDSHIFTDELKLNGSRNIFFTGDEYNACYYVTQGISHKEDGFSWTNGDLMHVSVPCVRKTGNVYVKINIIGTFNGKRTYAVCINGKEIMSGKIDGAGVISFKGKIIDGLFSFDLNCLDAQIIREIVDSDDPRKVAFQISKISIVEK